MNFKSEKYIIVKNFSAGNHGCNMFQSKSQVVSLQVEYKPLYINLTIMKLLVIIIIIPHMAKACKPVPTPIQLFRALPWSLSLRLMSNIIF